VFSTYENEYITLLALALTCLSCLFFMVGLIGASENRFRLHDVHWVLAEGEFDGRSREVYFGLLNFMVEGEPVMEYDDCKDSTDLCKECVEAGGAATAMVTLGEILAVCALIATYYRYWNNDVMLKAVGSVSAFFSFFFCGVGCIAFAPCKDQVYEDMKHAEWGLPYVLVLVGCLFMLNVFFLHLLLRTEDKAYTPLTPPAESAADKERAALEEAERMSREAEELARREVEAAERAAREEAERVAREEAERVAREEAERVAKEEAERVAKEEAERIAREKAEREEAERIAREKAAEEATRRELERQASMAQEEAERRAREQAEREEADRLAREKAEREEAERLAREKAEREEAERLAREKAEREEAERLAREKAEREEAERLAREKAEKEEAERLAREAQEAEAARLAEIEKMKEKARQDRIAVLNRIEDTLQQEIGFVKNDAHLTEDGKRVCDEVAATIVDYPELVIHIDSHTSCKAGHCNNGCRLMDLSQQRVEEVMRHLIEKGCRQKFIPKGYGCKHPELGAVRAVRIYPEDLEYD